MPIPLVFCHANSFPASTYRVLFQDLAQRGCAVHALEQIGHDPQYPVTNNWPHLAQQVLEFSRSVQQRLGQAPWLVGHSAGGYLALMVAAQAPGLARGVVLLDAPVVGGWRSAALGLMKRTALVGALSPGAVSSKRRNQWADVQDALEHFQRKKAFARWHPQVLQDYVEHATVPHEGKRVLAFTREVETAIYNTVPDHLERWLQRHPLPCPAAFIGGLQSAEIRQVGLGFTEKITQGRILRIDGSHLFPMEQPHTCGAALEAVLRNWGAF